MFWLVLVSKFLEIHGLRDGNQDPKMYVRYAGVMHTNSCVVLSETRMECRSPAVPFPESISPENPVKIHDYGFIMDDVISVQNLSPQAGFSPFILYPDPVYEKFDEEVKYYKSDYLTINGANLDRACQVTAHRMSTLRSMLTECHVNAPGNGRGSADRDGTVQRDVAVAEPADVPAAAGAAAGARLFPRRHPGGGGHRRRQPALRHRQPQLRVAQQRRGSAAQVGHHRRHHR